MHSSIPLLAASLAVVAAKVMVIDAGKDGFTYTPASATAAVGDTLEFHFYGSIHTAVQGPFNAPCSRGGANGFNSGSINGKSDGTVCPPTPIPLSLNTRFQFDLS